MSHDAIESKLLYASVILANSFVVIFYKKFKINKFMGGLLGGLSVYLIHKYQETNHNEETFTSSENTQDIPLSHKIRIFAIFIWTWVRDMTKLFFYSKLATVFVKGLSPIVVISALMTDIMLRKSEIIPRQLFFLMGTCLAVASWAYLKKTTGSYSLLWIGILLGMFVIDGCVITMKKDIIDELDVSQFMKYDSITYIVLSMLALTYFREWSIPSFASIGVFGILSPLAYYGLTYFRKHLSEFNWIGIRSLGLPFTAVLSMLFLKEKVSMKEWMIIVLILVCVIGMEYPVHHTFPNPSILQHTSTHY